MLYLICPRGGSIRQKMAFGSATSHRVFAVRRVSKRLMKLLFHLSLLFILSELFLRGGEGYRLSPKEVDNNIFFHQQPVRNLEI